MIVSADVLLLVFHSEEDGSSLWLTGWLFVGLLLLIFGEHMAQELGVVILRHSSLVLKPNKKYLARHNYSWDALGFHGPAQSWYILHTCAFSHRSTYMREHVLGWRHTVWRTPRILQCVKGIFSLYKTGRFCRNARYYYIINLVKLLKSDLLFKLIMGGWGSSMSLIEIWRQ